MLSAVATRFLRSPCASACVVVSVLVFLSPLSLLSPLFLPLSLNFSCGLLLAMYIHSVCPLCGD